jgi:hypothetical protein
MWNIPVTTDQTILANQPDIVLHDKKETEKLSKYKELEIKVRRM